MFNDRGGPTVLRISVIVHLLLWIGRRVFIRIVLRWFNLKHSEGYLEIFVFQYRKDNVNYLFCTTFKIPRIYSKHSNMLVIVINNV